MMDNRPIWLCFLTALPKDSTKDAFENVPVEGDFEMGSKTKKLKLIRARKRRPNRKNLKADEKRIQKNTEILRELSS
jgi:hypothetical protein